jgi:septum formation protein
MKNLDKKIYLASKSPRRRELLRQVGVEFDLLSLRSDAAAASTSAKTCCPAKPCRLRGAGGARKGRVRLEVLHLRRMPLRPVLSADTTVTIDGEILGKPANVHEAVAMLERLSGRTHQVLTSVALHHTDVAEQITQVSNVRFAKLSPADHQGLLRHARALRQGRRLRHPGPGGAVHRAYRGQPFGHHGPAGVRDGAAAAQGGRRVPLRQVQRSVPDKNAARYFGVVKRPTLPLPSVYDVALNNYRAASFHD